MLKRNSAELNTEKADRAKSSWVLVVNVLLLACAIVVALLYSTVYRQNLKQENLRNISNQNAAASANTLALFNSMHSRLNDTIKYAQTHSLDYEGLLEYINDSNSTPERLFELIGSDGLGHLAARNEDGSYPSLDYSHDSYETLNRLFKPDAARDGDEMKFTPEYTNFVNAHKYFAVYDYIELSKDGAAPQCYTLMLATTSSNITQLLNVRNSFEGQATVIIDAQGNYIVGNPDYKSANFFDYLYEYNDLPLDEKLAIEAEVTENGSGELYYGDSKPDHGVCVYRYERTEISSWYCITCVPLSSYGSPESATRLIIMAALIMLALFAVDMLWLQTVNSRLRHSVEREMKANAAKGSFMSRMSHEIRTPLNAVIGYNTIAASAITDAKTETDRRQADMKVMDCLAKSEIASKHLLTLINDVLDMSAIESGKILVARERFDFKGLIASLTTVFYAQARTKGVEFEVLFDTLTEEWFVGDQLRTNQILTNLLSNAIKFTPEGGRVCLRIVQPDADNNSAFLRFTVSDTGIGMDPQYLDRIWRPFEQADSSISRRFGGTGLGMSITKTLVDLMGGSIKVESKPGEGTTFTVDLTFELTEQSSTASAYDFSSTNALVVDDDASTCDYVRLLFNRCGARCTCVTSGADALQAVKVAIDDGTPYTICLVDWRMPKMDGIQTIERLHELVGDEMPMVVLTAYDYSEIADAASKIGVDRFISKPLFQSTLFDLLANVNNMSVPKKVKTGAQHFFNGERVLLAEDNAMNMEIAKMLLSSAGLVVDSAWNGREAVDMFTAAKPGTYLAILMDVHMPEMNGHEAARAIRSSSHEEAQSIPIIAMTADAFAENVAEAYLSGMNGHISKPIDINLLFETLRNCMS